MFPFNISSYIRDLITFDHLTDKNQVKFMQKHIILFHGSSQKWSKNSISSVSDKNTLHNLSFISVSFLIFELNFSKTNSQKLKVKFYSY